MAGVIAFVSLVIWVYLLTARGGFWHAAERDDTPEDEARLGALASWPSVAVVIPARNEADSIAQTVGSLCRQDYPGEFRIVVVDDQSTDGTAERARAAAAEAGTPDRLTVVTGAPLPEGWTGKLWALKQGDAIACTPSKPDWLLHTDADIAHTPDNLRKLVARGVHDSLTLVSLMAKLRCDAWFERALIPAFVLFFQMLYPFRWVNQRGHPLAAGAGGCMLIRRAALEAAGGIDSIRDEIIDDCALGRQLKLQGPIWLGLTNRAHSVRPYDDLGEIRRMVSRTAYAQLQYSPWLLAGTLVSLCLTFLAPPLMVLFAHGWGRFFGLLAWIGMSLAYLPMLRFYGRAGWWAPVLPAIAALYTAFTLDSAIQHWQGRGGMWKGRAQAKK
ncbi:glycosyltransferase [Pararobbsia silviterrae]|uniref:Glycosyltransferase n=1 Tax=Pararobbsia silviterrae TaxID=1792498 RepID=A0A494X769_9BURK|nr:glycosyltransferase [Pararobbsia silviterrae]RKP46565.1 glycosyltransferase [Pararobbsia silviterrae]